jgi:oligosaccharide repeat unit polymerase
MYVVMNLENFSHATDHLEHYTYGYFTLDFVTAIAGLKYWVLEYFGLDRMPFLFSSYNTYTAFWWFYSDFGVVGLAVIPLLLGFGAGALYYRMRQAPTIRRVTAYSVMVFVTAISFFVFPMANLWFEYNIAALYLILRWTIVPLDGADSARQVMGRDHAERLPE